MPWSSYQLTLYHERVTFPMSLPLRMFFRSPALLPDHTRLAPRCRQSALLTLLSEKLGDTRGASEIRTYSCATDDRASAQIYALAIKLVAMLPFERKRS